MSISPNLFVEYRETGLAIARHSFSLSFDPQEMSLNIDINMILPVKFSVVSSNLNSKRLTSSLSCNVLKPGKIPLEFLWLAVDSVKVSVILRRF